MGCHHAIPETSQGSGLYNYSMGWRFASDAYRTIMAYAPGTRITHFSNPDVTYASYATGVPLGQSNEAHNALTINNVASTVANWRQSAQTAQTFTIYNDGCGILNVTNITKQNGSAWLSFSPSAPFSISSGGSQTVTVSVNSAGLSAGSYSDRLLVYSNDSDESPYPGGVYVNLTVTCDLPSAPTSVSACGGTYCDRVQVSWNSVSGATGYEIWRSTSNNSSTATMIGTDNASPYDDYSAVAGTTYYYWVKATNSCGTSGFSSSNSGYRASIPSAPTGVSATDGIYPDKVQVSWNSASGATGYEIWRSTSNNSSTATMIGTDSASPYDDYGVTSGTTYYYWLKATNTCGTSGFSSSDSGFAYQFVYYTITSTAGAHGTVDPNGIFDVNQGDDQQFIATPEPNYLVDQWYLDGNSVQDGNTTYTLYNIQSDHTVHVTFRLPITLYVDANANGANDGSSWADAYNYLQDALSLAADSGGDINEIQVAQGVYNPDQGIHQTPGDREATFQLVNGVALRGGYAGFGEPNSDARDIELYDTILSGDLNDNDVDVDDPWDLLTEPTRGENSNHVVTVSETDATVILDGFTITSGNADGINPHNRGGGMYNEAGSLVVTNCAFIKNTADYDAGMVNFNDTSPELTNCSFNKNVSLYYGGGMANYYNNPTLTNCTFSENMSFNGGGMYNAFANSILTNCTFNQNYATNGGGIFNFVSDSTLINCTFTKNSATNNGGGIYNSSSNPTLTNCILWGNTVEGNSDEAAQIQGGTPSVMYSCIQDDDPNDANIPFDSTSNGNIDDNPLFADPNGPDGDPNTWEDNDYRLLSGSPCIDTGDPNYVLDPNYPTDLDGNPQVVNGRIDMGAYEYQSVSAILFSDDFITDTTGDYLVTDTWTAGGTGQFLYDPTGERAQMLTGDNVGLQFSHPLQSLNSGVFEIDFLPVEKYPAGGVISIRLVQDASNYYEVHNTDGYGPGWISKVAGGVEVDRIDFQNGYVQNNDYTIMISFSPSETTVSAFGEVLVMNADNSIINVNSFEVEIIQQDAYFDNILYTDVIP